MAERASLPEHGRAVARRASQKAILGQPGELRSCPNVVRRCSSSCSGGATGVDKFCAHISAPTVATLGRFRHPWSLRAQIWPILVDIGKSLPRRANICPASASVGRTWSDAAQSGPASAKDWPISTHLGQHRSDMGQSIGQHLQKFGRTSAPGEVVGRQLLGNVSTTSERWVSRGLPFGRRGEQVLCHVLVTTSSLP